MVINLINLGLKNLNASKKTNMQEYKSKRRIFLVLDT